MRSSAKGRFSLRMWCSSSRSGKSMKIWGCRREWMYSGNSFSMRFSTSSKFSVPSMTATVMWPGAGAQQIQDEVLNRMEKKFEQLDHFEKVVTFARQGYGGMTIT